MTAVAGVIAEYNPFHLGHAYQLSAIRRVLGADCRIVAVMSGNFVQRGECAILRKHARAEAAVRAGADLVLELPAPYAMAAAETFARGGTAVLAAAGVVTHLCFGSECGDIAPLRQAADCMDSEAYHAGLRRFLEEGMTFAAARQAAARELIGGAAECLSYPNNNLGVEYLRALRATDGGMEPMTVLRQGAGHDSRETGEYPSASLIRQRMLAREPWREMVPPETAAVAEREIAAGSAPASLEMGERAILAVLRTMGEAEFLPYDGGGEGLYRRFYRAVQTGTTLEEVLFLAKTKRYPLARLRRMAIAAYLHLAPPPERLPYLRLLAANERGCALLREMKEKAAVPIVTKPADVKKAGQEAEKLLAAEARCTALYTLCCPAEGPAAADSEYTTDPIILRKE